MLGTLRMAVDDLRKILAESGMPRETLAAAPPGYRLDVPEEVTDLGRFEKEKVAAALVDDRIAVETARAEAEIACGHAALVIGPLELLVAEHPYREPLWVQLITTHYSCQRQADALDAFQRVKSILADDLGIDPGQAISALHQRILRQEPLDVQGTAQATAVHTIGRLRPEHHAIDLIEGRAPRYDQAVVCPARDGHPNRGQYQSVRWRSHPHRLP